MLGCRSSSGNSLCGQNSVGFRESARPFKGIFCDDISEFESYHPSHAVGSWGGSQPLQPIKTMAAEPYVHNVPTLIGGDGRAALANCPQIFDPRCCGWRVVPILHCRNN